jgi:hypothetical protein
LEKIKALFFKPIDGALTYNMDNLNVGVSYDVSLGFKDVANKVPYVVDKNAYLKVPRYKKFKRGMRDNGLYLGSNYGFSKQQRQFKYIYNKSFNSDFDEKSIYDVDNIVNDLNLREFFNDKFFYHVKKFNVLNFLLKVQSRPYYIIGVRSIMIY